MKHFISLFILSFSILYSQPSVQEKQKIDYLLKSISESNLIFIRNGIEYDSQKARSHLESKYNYYESKINSVEDFIEILATKSSITGIYYKIKTKDNQTILAKDWLEKKLKLYEK